MDNGNNRVTTATGNPGEIQAEEKLTFDGTTLRLTGDTVMTGSLTAASKSFDIPHPSKEGFRLRYGVLEGPEHGVYVRGVADSDKIILPDHWVNLIDHSSITVQLTPKGINNLVYVDKIEGNVIYLKSDNQKINSYYFVQAERIDVEKILVEYKDSEI